MNHIVPPRVQTPDFWCSNFGKVQDYLNHRVRTGVVRELGPSSLGYPVRCVEYGRDDGIKLMVVGGTHGHEPGTVAAAMNLVHLLEQGQDLAGATHPRLLDLLQDVHLYIVPCLNPDGRTVCPDSFYCQSTETVRVYSSGLQLDGSLIPYDSESQEPLYYFDPAQALFIGGQFNGAGYASNRRRSADHSDAVEVQALLDFVDGLGVQAIVDLHACGYNLAIQVRSHEPPYWDVLREWQRRAKGVFAAKGRPLQALHGDGDPPDPIEFYTNSYLLHHRGQLLCFSYEGRQGYLGARSFMPLPTEWEIVDDYLTAVTLFVELGIEGFYERANREVFEKGSM